MIAADPTINPEEHLGLARKFVLNRFGCIGPLEDSEEYSFACVALIKAAKTFKGGVAFSTYAWECMNRAFKFKFRTQKRHPLPKFVDPDKFDRIVNENCTGIDVEGTFDLGIFLSDDGESHSEKLDREMLVQHYLHQKTLCQIGKMYGVGKMRVKQRIDRAIRKIRSKYKVGSHA